MALPRAGGSTIVKPELIDRRGESAALGAMLEEVRQGLSATLVVRGELGIGKTALLEQLAATATGFRVIRALGIESEMSLGFSGLHQLLVPFLPQLDVLPAPQREALRIAFGLAPGAAAERFQVGLATLSLLSVAAGEKPLLAIVDDAQWLDIESAEVLAFVARRLHAEGIAMLFGIRDPVEHAISFAGVPELRLGPLEDQDAEDLLATVVPRSIGAATSQRFLEQANGNPLAILELGAGLVHGSFAGSTPLAEPVPVDTRLQEHFLSQFRELGPDTQTFLRLASAESSSDPVVVWRAARELGLDKSVFAEAEAKRLVVAGPQLSFRHPVIRSAIYHGMTPLQRREAHAALARATDPNVDGERHAAHRALATVEPDDQLADQLAQCAEQAERRGAYAAWAALACRAAELTADADSRATRMLDAAEALLAAGRIDRARASLEQAMPGLRQPLQQARAHALSGGIRVAAGEGGETPRILLDATRAAASLDPNMAQQFLLEALRAATFTQPARGGPLMKDIAAQAIELLPPSEEGPVPLVLRAYAALVMSGYATAAPLLREAITTTLRAGRDEPDPPYRLASLAAYSLFDDRAVHALARDWVEWCRERAALTSLPIALIFRASTEIYSGRLDEAAALFKESLEISQATGNLGIFGLRSRGDVLLTAWRGSEAQAREASAAHAAEALSKGQVQWAGFAGFALTTLDIALGRYRPALEAALPIYKDDPTYTGSWVLPELIEAAVRVGEVGLASAALARLDERARAGGTSLGLGLLARTRALLTNGTDAEDLYRESIHVLGDSPSKPQLARAHLLYGEWLRRENRRRDARGELRAAFEMFSGMGINGFAERARIELLATGERVRRRSVETQDHLSAQEIQVARLAAQGVRNQEIASQLFISDRTVEYHLGKVFRKLGVSSRTELARAPQVVGSAG